MRWVLSSTVAASFLRYLLALSPLNAVESMAVMMFAGAALSALMVWLPSRKLSAR
ncbi:hypothetical protein [Rothia mucilaginosa]|uniref:hypothetical protein n=1 Tax=Rothia mucilaginosa TaxID=43675 RepID=UPI00143C8CA8|nr:hypothetical protein [Rothia mucilaginosa]